MLCRALFHDSRLPLHLLRQLPLHRETLALLRCVRRALVIAALHQHILPHAPSRLGPHERGVLVGGALVLPLRRRELLAHPLGIVRSGARRRELAGDLGRLWGDIECGVMHSGEQCIWRRFSQI